MIKMITLEAVKALVSTAEELGLRISIEDTGLHDNGEWVIYTGLVPSVNKDVVTIKDAIFVEDDSNGSPA